MAGSRVGTMVGIAVGVTVQGTVLAAKGVIVGIGVPKDGVGEETVEDGKDVTMISCCS